MAITCALTMAFVAIPGSPATAQEAGFEPIFDGETLEGWDGDPRFWRVEDGAITGESTEENPVDYNTFLIWRAGETRNFELKLEYRIESGNSGIQYRSFELDREWAIGGYQADLEAGDQYSGINYGERFRGILAQRGQKTILREGEDPEVVETFGESEELQSHIKKDGWNEYHIIARGYHFVHKINGHVMSEVIDKDKANRRDSGLLALQLHTGPPMKVQFRNIRIKHLPDDLPESDEAGADSPKKVVFVAGGPSHGYGAHEHKAGSLLLAEALDSQMSAITTEVFTGGWPDDPNAFEGADAIVMYCDGGGGHMVNNHLDQVNELAEQGVGIAALHYGVEVPEGEPGDHFLDWIGGYFETHWSVNPHWTASFEDFPDHPIARGVQPFEIRDEWYYHMRFQEDGQGVIPLLTDLPPEETLDRPDGAHSNNPHVREAVLENQEPQHVAWAYERPEGGRGFGFTGGHFHWNWGHDQFRKLVLNAIAWTAEVEVPESGVESPTPTVKDLMKNQDFDPPDDWDPESIEQKLRRWNETSTGSAQAEEGLSTSSDEAGQPLFESEVITGETPGHAVEVDVALDGAEKLFLVVTDGGDGISCDWADWAEPRLVGPDGETRLTELEWARAESGWGAVRRNRNAGDTAGLRIAGTSVPYGIGTHANSVVAYDLPDDHNYQRFQAVAGLDNGGTDQNNGESTSVRFAVYTEEPPDSVLQESDPDPAEDEKRAPEYAVENLDVHEGLEVELFASEPMMLSPSNIDIDAQGRVWVCEVQNYRHRQGTRPEGDRILILEDTNGDGQADSKKVFYQGEEINAALGITVLGNRVIVACSPNVFVFTDEDGDDKPDRKEVLFTGIGGEQHDHAVHAFVFGPDGKFYFNMGNEGDQIKRPDGSIVVDQAGNEVKADLDPYQQGMVFRCNPDGSEFETLGWNFRNNYEVTVDSFGTMWQSDNDDDGNRGVRINYVMEYGNYGYRDERTGAGWREERAGMAEDIPTRHWYQNDPGVIPNLLQTGAGSPTGICIYEGDLLPEVFQNEMIHCDAGPNVTRAYPVKKEGAGYQAEIVNILEGARDQWFRPSDVAVAPDGSLIVADWYDPGVGGHRMGEVERGRLFRVTPKGHSGYEAPEFDFETAAGAAEALKNPNYAVRYLAWTALHEMGQEAESALLELWQSSNPRYRARALWLLGKIPDRGEAYVRNAIDDENPDIRITGLRLARQLEMKTLPVIGELVEDPSPQVRREAATALRHQSSDKAVRLWADLALQHDGKDRWYLEALGIAADGKWDRCLAAWLERVGDDWKTAAGRDIIWRSRATKTPKYLAELILSPETSEEEEERYFRAMDFQSGPEKQRALRTLIGQVE